MSQTALTVGTEYLDRKITGTGTEDNPWIIGSAADDTDENMFQNFLDIVYTPNAYVKLAKDIDVSQSKTYREGLGNYITINARKIYADESKAAIKNLITKTCLFYILNGAANTIMNNIQFLNCIVNDATSPVLQSRYDTNDVSYCDFSLLVRGTGNSVTLCNSTTNVVFSHCSIDIKCVNAFLGNNGICSLKNCQINFVGNAIQFNSGTTIFNSLTKCGITGAINFPNGTTAGRFSSKCNYCYFALDINTSTQFSAIFDKAAGSYANTNCYYCINYGENVSTLDESSYPSITSDQLKSKEYLYEIGFLP